MKLTEIRIQNFRSFKDETILLDDYTCLVGPNGSGKSAVLMALNVFFRNNDATITNMLDLSREDFHHENVQNPVRIALTFEELPKVEDVSENVRDMLDLYARHGKLVFFAEAKWNEATAQIRLNLFYLRKLWNAYSLYTLGHTGNVHVTFYRIREATNY